LKTKQVIKGSVELLLPALLSTAMEIKMHSLLSLHWVWKLKVSLTEAIENTQINTRHIAKRQLT